MIKTITNKVVAIATLLAMTLPMALFAYDAGNDAVPRANVDTYSDFTIVDTNNPFATDGFVEMFEYHAVNTKKFQVLIVDETNVVKWVSPEITPGVGLNTYSPNPMPAVEAGWDLAIYSVATGVIPFDYNAAAEPAAYEGNGAGLPTLGETLTFAGYTDRYYSLNATLSTDDDGDGVENSVDLCPGTMPDSFGQWGESQGRYQWNGTIWDSSGKGAKGFNPDMDYTYGCSGKQILDAMSEATGEDFGGHYKFGVTKSILEAWHAGEYNMGPAVLETVFVSSESGDTTSSVMVGEDGVDYTLNAYGTYRFANWGDYGIADAEWAYRDAPHTPDNIAGWIKGEGYYASACGLDVQVDGGCVDWGAFSETNEYSLPYTGTGAPIEFSIYDNNYDDNDDGINVDIVGDLIVSLW